jgi:hypothetical protein
MRITYALIILAAVLVVGCGSQASPVTPSVSSLIGDSATPALATSVPSVSAPTASPSPDPEAIRKAAAVAYAGAAAKANADFAALDKKYRTLKTLKIAHAYWKAAGAITGRFIAAVKGIAVPTDTAADLHALVARDAASQASEIEQSMVSSADYNDAYKVWTARARASTAAANLVRVDLGLPPVK